MEIEVYVYEHRIRFICNRKITLHATEMGRKLYKKFGFVEVADEMVLNL